MAPLFNSSSHEAFTVTGKVSHVHSENLAQEMQDIWHEAKTTDYLFTILEPTHPILHAVFFNYSETGFDLIIGLITPPGVIQTNSLLTTIEVPAQNYRYAEFDFTGSESVVLAWDSVNAISSEDLPRKFGYDLEMYSEDMKKFTIAVSV